MSDVGKLTGVGGYNTIGSTCVPKGAWRYLDHTSAGKSLRQVARQSGCYPSTVIRQVRKLENRRDDPLVDEALNLLEQAYHTKLSKKHREHSQMSNLSSHPQIATKPEVEREARRILRRLCETSAFLVVGWSLDKAVVMREAPNKKTIRIAVVERRIVQAFALNDWIAVFHSGKVLSYEITQAGRAALKRLLAEDQNRKSVGFGESASSFSAQHKDWGTKVVADPVTGTTKLRYNLAESPLTALGRKKGKDGKCFLGPEHLQAGERLREDFELAQMGPRVTQNWDRFLTVGHSGTPDGSRVGEGPSGARQRVADALKDLGPGLGDVVLRCCCYLEGLEMAEKRMGWSARSGKIVLRIALQHLRVHYDSLNKGAPPLID